MLHSLMPTRPVDGRKTKRSPTSVSGIRPKVKIHKMKSSHDLDEIVESNEIAECTSGSRKKIIKDDVLRLNIGGKSFMFLCSQFKSNGSDLLSDFVSREHEERIKLCHVFLEGSREYFWSRSSDLFLPIAEYYYATKENLTQASPSKSLRSVASRRMSLQKESPSKSSYISTQNPPTYNEEDEDNEMLDHNDNKDELHIEIDDKSSLHQSESHKNNPWSCRSIKHLLWSTTENPEFGGWAKLWAAFSITAVVTSITCLILGSMDNFQDKDGDPSPVLKFCENVSVVWFTFELITRFSVCPDRIRFFKSVLNVIDLLSIVPFYFELTVELIGAGDSRNLEKLQGLMLVLRILKVLRVSRIFKLARYSSGMQNFGLVLKESISELGILCLSLITAVVFFSTLMYFLEKDDMDSPFVNIPSACWWAIITMTTVGYGDFVPVTAAGKVLASITSISGVLVLAFPVTTIVGNFHKFQQRQQEELLNNQTMTKSDSIDEWHPNDN